MLNKVTLLIFYLFTKDALFRVVQINWKNILFVNEIKTEKYIVGGLKYLISNKEFIFAYQQLSRSTSIEICKNLGFSDFQSFSTGFIEKRTLSAKFFLVENSKLKFM